MINNIYDDHEIFLIYTFNLMIELNGLWQRPEYFIREAFRHMWE